MEDQIKRVQKDIRDAQKKPMNIIGTIILPVKFGNKTWNW